MKRATSTHSPSPLILARGALAVVTGLACLVGAGTGLARAEGRGLSMRERSVARLEVKDARRFEREALAPADPLLAAFAPPTCAFEGAERFKCGVLLTGNGAEARLAAQLRVRPTFSDGSVGISAALVF